MEQYNVTGMSCAACSARVEKAVSKVEGVTSCSVSLLTNSMGVKGTASPDAIIDAVTKAGYGASLKGGDTAQTASPDKSALEDHDTPVLKKRLIASVGFLAVLMYISMGHMMWNWPLPSFFNGNHIAMGLVQMLLTAQQEANTGPEVFRQRFPEPASPFSEHGHPGRTGFRRSICVQHLCPVCHDRCPGERQYGCSHELYARVLL